MYEGTTILQSKLQSLHGQIGVEDEADALNALKQDFVFKSLDHEVAVLMVYFDVLKRVFFEGLSLYDLRADEKLYLL